MRALVVDDSRTMRLILCSILSKAGFAVQGCEDGPSCLGALDESPEVDLLLVDWHMPNMTGLEVIDTVRSPKYAYRGLLIVVTAETDPVLLQQALTAGADEYLTKPFEPLAIIDKLRLLGVDV